MLGSMNASMLRRMNEWTLRKRNNSRYMRFWAQISTIIFIIFFRNNAHKLPDI